MEIGVSLDCAVCCLLLVGHLDAEKVFQKLRIQLISRSFLAPTGKQQLRQKAENILTQVAGGLDLGLRHGLLDWCLFLGG